MKKLLIFGQTDAEAYERKLMETAQVAHQRIQALLYGAMGLDFLERLKFEKVGCDPLDKGRPLNLIEQINQTFTYLASFRAASLLFQWHSALGELTLNLGSANGSDMESVDDGGITAEVFAATSPNSNQKLKKDITKVRATAAKHKYVFFMCPGIKEGPFKYSTADGVTVWSLRN